LIIISFDNFIRKFILKISGNRKELGTMAYVGGISKESLQKALSFARDELRSAEKNGEIPSRWKPESTKPLTENEIRTARLLSQGS
jgi:hypothetical protein